MRYSHYLISLLNNLVKKVGRLQAPTSFFIEVPVITSKDKIGKETNFKNYNIMMEVI
mgnify:CR=1 FL=1